MRSPARGLGGDGRAGYGVRMSDAFAEAISDDDSPAPAPSQARIPLLGDPRVEGNEHLLDYLDAPDPEDADGERRDFSSDDIHYALSNSDVQN